MINIISKRLKLSERFEGYPLLTTDAVLLEIGNALAREYKEEAVDIIEELLHSEEVEIVPLTPSLFDQAFEIYKTYQDKEWGLIDCVSFVVMRETHKSTSFGILNLRPSGGVRSAASL